MNETLVILRDYLRGVWRRRWYAMAAAWGLSIVGWLAVAVIPNQYDVQAKVYVDTDSLLAPLLKGLAVSQNLDQQVTLMLRTLLTRPNLEQVVRMTDPKSLDRSAEEINTKIDTLKEKIEIKPLPTKNLFTLGMRDSSPEHAQAVVQTLVNILIENSLGDQRRNLAGAQEFVDKKIREYETLLREAEQRRATFKEANAEYFGADGTVRNALGKATDDLQASQRDLEAAQTRRDILRAQLAVTKPTIEGRAPTSIYIAGNNERDQAAQDLSQARVLLSQLETKYTANHPDVVAQRKVIASLEERVNAAKDNKGAQVNTGVQSVPNPLYEQLTIKLAEEEGNIALFQRRIERAREDLRVARDKQRETATIEAKYADLDRDYEVVRKNYEELLQRRESARLSQAVDDRRDTITFRVIEAPQRSMAPVFPNRALFNTGVLVVAIGAGFALALALTMLDTSMRSVEALRANFDLPVLGVVTRLRKGSEAAAMRAAVMRYAALGVVLLICYGGVLMLTSSALATGAA